MTAATAARPARAAVEQRPCITCTKPVRTKSKRFVTKGGDPRSSDGRAATVLTGLARAVATTAARSLAPSTDAP